MYEWTIRYRCPFEGKPSFRVPKTSRWKAAGSTKIRCLAAVEAKKRLDEGIILVSVSPHANHVVISIYSREQDLISTFVEVWLKMIVENRVTWAHFNNQLRQDSQDVNKFESTWDAYKTEYANNNNWLEYLDSRCMSSRESWLLYDR